jgi:ATP-dependent Lon protease
MNLSAQAHQLHSTMSPFTIKKNKKTGNLLRILGSGKPTYKKHRDDEDNKGIPESDTGSGSDSEGGESSSTVSSVSVQERRITRSTNNRTHAKKNTAITKKTKTDAANMVVGKIAEALASSVIAAAIAGGKDKKKSGKSKHHRRRDEDDEHDDVSIEDDEEERVDESDENSDTDDDNEVDREDDDEEDSEYMDEDSDEESNDDDDSDDEDSEENSDEDDYDSDDDEYSDDDDDYSDTSSEEDIARHKRHQKAMELRCEKNKKKLADIKETIQSLSATMSSNPTLAANKFMKKQVEEMKQKQRDIENELRSDEKKRDKLNVKEFKTLLRKKNSTNDLRYFRRHMTPEQQQKVIADLKQIHAVSIIQKPYRLSLLETDIPIAFKAIAMRKINSLRHMEPGCGEYYKVKNWVDTFMKIPFGRTKNLPLTIEDGLQRCSEFMEASKTTLDNAVYGLNDAKLQIMQMVGQWISNPTAMGSAIAIKGPMGTGKTSLVKEGISKILGRDFAFIALGGATDSSFLEGHSYTYEGSTWGKIVEIIIQCGSMNPVIYFDELDKISETAKGEEIVGILTHLTDTSQNSQFHDRYFAEIDFDLSKCLFIFSYNDESKVNPILLDRMYRINTTGYNKKDKTQIAQKYLIPKICAQVGFREGDIVIPDSVIEHIVENYTEKEEGVRNLKRCLEVVHRKLNLYRLIRPDTPLFEKEMSLKVAFPFAVTTDVVDKLVKQANEDKRVNLNLYL